MADLPHCVGITCIERRVQRCPPFGERRGEESEQAVAEVKEVQANVQKAQEAVSTPDPARDDRLRKRFDRSSG